MEFLNFQTYSLWINVAAFAVCAAVVWAAGTRLSRYLDKISRKTGIGHAFVGMLMLGGITSLPEVATVATASYSGNAPLAVNNLLGSVAFNVVLLALADALLGRDALTAVVAKPATLLQGTLNILLLAVVVVAILAGDVAFLGVGAWSAALVPLFVFAVWLSSRYGQPAPWVPNEQAEREQDTRKKSQPGGESSLAALIGKTAVAALAILFAGFVLAKTGDAIATKTGLGASLIGLVLVSAATSLPETGSIYAAVRLKRYEMAIGDIFGGNLFNIVLIFLADAVYTGDGGSSLVLNQAGPFEAVATLLGIVLTCFYLLGLLERKDRTIFRMGYDSLAVIVTYGGGLVLLYFLQSGGGGSG